MSQCVYCDKTSDLNTSLTIKLEDGNRVSVDICDEHAEDATIKTARQAYSDKQQKIADVLAQAKALGLDITESSGGLVVATKTEPEIQPQPQETQSQPQETQSQPQETQSQPQETQSLNDMDGDDIVDTTRIDLVSAKGMKSVGGSAAGHTVSSHASHEVVGKDDVLPAEVLEGKARMGIVEGREGMPLAIPEKRVDGTGTTHIKIITSNDQQLQDRFKKMAGESIDGRQSAAYDPGADPVNCGFCRGSGRVKHQGEEIECPKCKGAGLISTY